MVMLISTSPKHGDSLKPVSLSKYVNKAQKLKSQFIKNVMCICNRDLHDNQSGMLILILFTFPTGKAKNYHFKFYSKWKNT